MIVEERYIRFMGEDDIKDVLSFAREFEIEGRGIVELSEDPYIEFDEPVDDSLLMDIGQYLLIATTEPIDFGDEGEQRAFILDKLEFDNRLKSGAVIEFERLLNILVPTLTDNANIYQIISDIMEVNIYSKDIKIVYVDGEEVEIKLNFDQSIPLVYKVDLV